MNVLYIGYWSAYDGLSISSIKPNLEVLSQINRIKNIYFVSLEREFKTVEINWNLKKVTHLPLYLHHLPLGIDKIRDLLFLSRKMRRICKDKSVDYVICRSSMAGIFGYQIWKKLKIPYVVESFEPHADYMSINGVWNRMGVKYRTQKFFETKQKVTADYLLPLTFNWAKKMIDEGVDEQKILVLPCVVDIIRYRFNKNARIRKRDELGLDDNMCLGIYVGKIGGLYYREELLRLLKGIIDKKPEFRILILSPQDLIKWKLELTEANIPSERCFLMKVPYEEVADYLSASDIAFNFHRSSRVSQAFSPIKNGEYWANGLPILIGNGIGDDSDNIEKHGGGMVISMGNLEDALTEINEKVHWKKLVSIRPNKKAEYLAKNFRNSEMIKSVYHQILN